MTGLCGYDEGYYKSDQFYKFAMKKEDKSMHGVLKGETNEINS